MFFFCNAFSSGEKLYIELSFAGDAYCICEAQITAWLQTSEDKHRGTSDSQPEKIKQRKAVPTCTRTLLWNERPTQAFSPGLEIPPPVGGESSLSLPHSLTSHRKWRHEPVGCYSVPMGLSTAVVGRQIRVATMGLEERKECEVSVWNFCGMLTSPAGFRHILERRPKRAACPDRRWLSHEERRAFQNGHSLTTQALKPDRFLLSIDRSLHLRGLV